MSLNSAEEKDKKEKTCLHPPFSFSCLITAVTTQNENMEEQDPYGAIKFGEFRKYMQNKQSKLKQQEQEL